MGTNYYIRDKNTDDPTNPNLHIGKRSAAGAFCSMCEITLCKEGKNYVHQEKATWYNRCPSCGYMTDTTCCSFTFAMKIDEVVRKLKLKGFNNFTDRGIIDEYGRLYTLNTFYKLVNDCPIRFYLIGQEFS